MKKIGIVIILSTVLGSEMLGSQELLYQPWIVTSSEPTRVRTDDTVGIPQFVEPVDRSVQSGHLKVGQSLSKNPIFYPLQNTPLRNNLESLDLVSALSMLPSRDPRVSPKSYQESVSRKDLDRFSGELQNLLQSTTRLEEGLNLLEQAFSSKFLQVRNHELSIAQHVPNLEKYLKEAQLSLLYRLRVTKIEDLVQAGDEKTYKNYSQQIQQILNSIIIPTKKNRSSEPSDAPVKRYKVALLEYIKRYLDARWQAFNTFQK